MRIIDSKLDFQLNDKNLNLKAFKKVLKKVAKTRRKQK